MSCIFGKNRDIFFPKLSKDLDLITFSEIAIKYLKAKGYEPYLCSSEEEARKNAELLIESGRWPCCFFPSDTTGEKDFEEFFTDSETLDMERFENLGTIKNEADFDKKLLKLFENSKTKTEPNIIPKFCTLVEFSKIDVLKNSTDL